MPGWVKLHRLLNDNPLWTAEPFTYGQAWVDLFMNANHKDGSFFVRQQEVFVKRGQIGWSELKMQKRWKWSRGKVRRYIGMLSVRLMVVQHPSRLTTILTICNYEEFQGSDTTDSTTDDTTDSTTSGHQTVHKQECKNEKKGKKGKKVKKTKTLTPAELEGQGKRREIWDSYKDSFFARYSVDPVRNAKVNALIKQLHERLGEEAKFVAAFYVTINDQFLIKQSHSLEPLLKNCEGYITQWRRGQAVTTTSARQTDQSQSNYDAAEEAIAIRRARNANGK